LQEVYSTLQRKEEASKITEKKFSNLVHDKEAENVQLRTKLEKLEISQREELNKILRLEKEMR